MLCLFGPGLLDAADLTSVLIHRETFLITRAAAAAICAWTRLATVQLINVDMHVTRDDEDSDDPATHEFFLFKPPPTGQGPPKIVVIWKMFPEDEENRRKTEELEYAHRLRQPVEYFARRRPIERRKIRIAFLILTDKAEETRQMARKDVPEWLKIMPEPGVPGK